MIDDQKIRERAYELWELAGKPDGAEQEHWRQAVEQLKAEQQPPGANRVDSVSGATQSGVPLTTGDQ
ncbi:DUF2934 domain-containing protein [Pseudomonas fulva]|nr:DUF2934 domain-containing protein [Pseudomonas fulva]MBF8779320.1 DUF2934 domain-containing protein [Pseudomonas fulva]